MFKIVINNAVAAVSETMESAIQALSDLLCNYAGIGNPNLIHWDNNGIIVNPECNIAKASVTVLDMNFDIFICKIQVV